MEMLSRQSRNHHPARPGAEEGSFLANETLSRSRVRSRVPARPQQGLPGHDRGENLTVMKILGSAPTTKSQQHPMENGRRRQGISASHSIAERAVRCVINLMFLRCRLYPTLSGSPLPPPQHKRNQTLEMDLWIGQGTKEFRLRIQRLLSVRAQSWLIYTLSLTSYSSP